MSANTSDRNSIEDSVNTAWRALLDNYAVKDSDVKNISESKSLYHGMVFHQKSHVWVAPPNGGKTTIAATVAAHIAVQKYQVIYINLDMGSADLKYYQKHASNYGYKLICPLASKADVPDCIQLVNGMSRDNDLEDTVLFLDTLKKFTDPFSKSDSRKFYELIRNLTRNGCTVISLAHTNKHGTSDGKLIYEGTGDLKSDTDIMMMLYHEKKGYELRVSTEFEKARAPVVPHSFIIDSDRNVTICETYASYREVTNNGLKENQDEAIILFIKQILAVQAVNQIHILKECQNKEMGGTSHDREDSQTIPKHTLDKT